MSQASQLSPELAQGVLLLARALIAANRSWSLYPPEHPAVAQSVARLVDAIRQSSLGLVISIGVTPETLIVETVPADPGQPAIAEAAALLHDRDILQLTLAGDVTPDAVQRLLHLLALDAPTRRSRGGPSRIWEADGHRSIAIEQIDYERFFAEREGEVAEPARRDDLWRSIVSAMTADPKAAFDERQQERLLAIAASSGDIGDLARAVMAPKCAADGSPMLTTQAATVLATFRHLATIVSVRAPERLPQVMSNLTAAAAQLDPHVVMQLMQQEDDPSGIPIVGSIAGSFDDGQVAQLLATALALEGQASDRLAAIFNTIAPDEERKRRVLTLTRHLLSESDFGRSGQFQALWTSMEELLVSYNEKPFVSDSYRVALDGVATRAERMARGDLPPELPVWMESLGQANVRTLSVTLLMDLLTLERDATRAGEIADDMEALAEDLLMSGAYEDARTVTTALADRAASKATGHEACARALDRLGESGAMRETASLIEGVDDASWQAMRFVLTTVGAASVEALKPRVAVEAETEASRRAGDLIVAFGAAAVHRLAPLLSDDRWFVPRNAARLLGRIAAPEGVGLLTPLLRKSDPRVAREAVSALCAINDPAAARAISTLLRAATGELRHAVVEALVADRDPRVIPMLVRIVEESQPLGDDHEVVLETLNAMGTLGHDQAIPAIVAVIHKRGFFGRARLRGLKERGVDALVRIGSAAAQAALDAAARRGDRMLKRVVARRGRVR